MDCSYSMTGSPRVHESPLVGLRSIANTSQGSWWFHGVQNTHCLVLPTSFAPSLRVKSRLLELLPLWVPVLFPDVPLVSCPVHFDLGTVSSMHHMSLPHLKFIPPLPWVSRPGLLACLIYPSEPSETWKVCEDSRLLSDLILSTPIAKLQQTLQKWFSPGLSLT